MPAISFGIATLATLATFLVMVSRGFRFAATRRVRLALPVFSLKDPLAFGEVSFLSWTIFFFFGTDFLVDDSNSFIFHPMVGKWFLAFL
jgi:hypothetical protein